MCSCSNLKQKKEYLCKYISFEKSGANILVCALISDISKASESINELETIPVTASAQTVELAFSKLTSDYPRIYYKALDSILVSQNLNLKEQKELCNLILNNVNFPLQSYIKVLEDISPAMYLNTFPDDAQISTIPLYDYILENLKRT